jgi:hypothetical protein
MTPFQNHGVGQGQHEMLQLQSFKVALPVGCKRSATVNVQG